VIWASKGGHDVLAYYILSLGHELMSEARFKILT